MPTFNPLNRVTSFATANIIIRKSFILLALLLMVVENCNIFFEDVDFVKIYRAPSKNFNCSKWLISAKFIRLV